METHELPGLRSGRFYYNFSKKTPGLRLYVDSFSRNYKGKEFGDKTRNFANWLSDLKLDIIIYINLKPESTSDLRRSADFFIWRLMWTN